VKVLLVEDNPIDTRLVRALVEGDGHEVTALSSGRGALECIIEQQPDVLLVDLNLPAIDGLELVRAVRAHENTSKLPVLAMTAYPNRYSFREVRDAGCTAWIIKPIDTRNLVGQLRALCTVSQEQRP
jgi:CheY-like chemotaxis protein